MSERSKPSEKNVDREESKSDEGPHDRDYLLKVRELDLRDKELDAKIKGEKQNIVWASPLLIATLTAIFGLLGTGIGAVLQGYWNTTLERQKFESTLIQKAMETTNQEDAKRNLLFLVKTGLLQSLDGARIESIANDPKQLPISSIHGAVNSGEISIVQAKEILKEAGLYDGEINEVNDKQFMEAVKDFQKKYGLTPDGALGLATAKSLKSLR